MLERILDYEGAEDIGTEKKDKPIGGSQRGKDNPVRVKNTPTTVSARGSGYGTAAFVFGLLSVLMPMSLLMPALGYMYGTKSLDILNEKADPKSAELSRIGLVLCSIAISIKLLVILGGIALYWFLFGHIGMPKPSFLP